MTRPPPPPCHVSYPVASPVHFGHFAAQPTSRDSSCVETGAERASDKVKRNAFRQNRTQRTPSLPHCPAGSIFSNRGFLCRDPDSRNLSSKSPSPPPPLSLLPAALESFYLSESSSPYLEIAPAFCGDGGDEEDCGTHMHSPSASVRPARLPE